MSEPRVDVDSTIVLPASSVTKNVDLHSSWCFVLDGESRLVPGTPENLRVVGDERRELEMARGLNPLGPGAVVRVPWVGRLFKL